MTLRLACTALKMNEGSFCQWIYLILPLLEWNKRGGCLTTLALQLSFVHPCLKFNPLLVWHFIYKVMNCQYCTGRAKLFLSVITSFMGQLFVCQSLLHCMSFHVKVLF
jgi:hypothetical protein